jgi:hypothetical protein
MSIVYNVKAGIVNESVSEFARLAAKILQVSKHGTESFVKTFPIVTHPKNLSILSQIEKELPPYKKAAYLGISFVSYGFVNFIEFTSCFGMFQLNKGDKITFYFEGEEEPMEFSFQFPRKEDGRCSKNIHPIRDQELQLLKSNNLDYWKITNSETGKFMIGGFTFNELNKQYKSKKIGQKLFRLMSENIMITKTQLIKQS